MNHEQAQQGITIIKNMIEKSRRIIVASAPLFIGVGLFTITVIMAMQMFQRIGVSSLKIPLLIFMLLGNGLIGFYSLGHRHFKENVISHFLTAFFSLCGAVGVLALLIGFLFPMSSVYPYSFVPVISFTIMGIGFFVTGLIYELYELRFIMLYSFVWLTGGCLIAYIDGIPQLIVALSVVMLGFIMPGIVLNNNYNSRSASHEA